MSAAITGQEIGSMCIAEAGKAPMGKAALESVMVSSPPFT